MEKTAIKDINIVAENILSFLRDYKIQKFEDYALFLNKGFIQDKQGKQICFEMRPSCLKTFAHVLSYNVLEKGIVLELEGNLFLNYSKIITKGEFQIQRYESFAKDSRGQIIQSKLIKSSDFGLVTSELERLAMYEKI
ncbi:hypothetical protein ACFLZF_00810 [Nanoarchaeota archaeon]